MAKEPNKKPDDMNEDEQQITVMNVPLTILVSAAMNSADVFNWIFKAAEVLVVFVLTYQILGKTLFVALVVTPLLVLYLENVFACYEAVYNGDGWDDDDSEDGDDGFGDHWNNLTKK